MITFSQYISEAKPLTKKAAEEKFLFGDCASYAVAFQELFGGELHALYRTLSDGEVRAYHAYVKLNGKNYDVKGQRNTHSMIKDFTGSYDHEGFEAKGPFKPDELKTGKAKPSLVLAATEYIKINGIKP